mgnify:CR=1 FL=1
MNIRIGHGIDVHKLRPNIPFKLGGIAIDSPFGIEGHSDGDALIHSLVDALLGAMSLGDIGLFFPSNNLKFENKSSEFFLLFALDKMKELCFNIVNIDINIILEAPKINIYIPKMKLYLSNLIGISIKNISIKATTTDGLGFIGKSKGILSTATVLIEKNEN